jgi:phage-related minor tail protein
MADELKVGVTVSPEGAEAGSKAAADSIKSAADSIKASLDNVQATMNSLNTTMASAFANVGKQVQAGGAAAEEGMRRIERSGTGVRRELLVLAHEISQGQWTRFGGSLIVMGERMDLLRYLASPTGVAFGLIAGAIGLMVTAAIKGHNQLDQLNRDLILSGNYAGLTADKYIQMARAIQSGVGGGVIDAQKALSATAATGVFGPNTVQSVASAVDKIAQLSGQTADKVAADFAKMENGVTKWAETSKIALNNLTVSDQQYIRSLEQHGKAQEAMAFAADRINAKLKDTATQLGYLPGLLKTVSTAWQEFWNAAMDLGRPTTPEQRLATLNKQLSELRGHAFAQPGGLLSAGYDKMASEAANLQEEIRLKERSLSLENQKNEVIRKGKAADTLAASLREQAGGAEVVKQKIDEYRRSIAALTEAKKYDSNVQVPSAAEQARVEAYIRSRNLKADKTTPAGEFSAARAQAQAEVALLRDNLNNQERILQQSYQNQEISIREFYDRKRKLVEDSLALELRVRQEELGAAQRAASGSATAEQRLQAQAKIVQVQGQINLLRQQETNQIAALNAEEARSITQQEKRLQTIRAETQERLNNMRIEEQLNLVKLGFDKGGAGRISQVEMIEQQKQLELQRTAIAQEGLWARLAIEGQSPVEVAKILSQIEIEQEQHTNKMKQLAAQQAEAYYKPFQDAANVLQSSFSNLFSTLGDRTKTLSQKFMAFFDSVAQGLARIGANLIAQNLFGGGTGTGGNSGGGLLGGLFGSIMGMVASYDVGTEYVPKTGLALIHEGERIVPARDNASGNFGKGMTVQNQFVVNGPIDNRTQAQIAAMVASASSRALRRNG